MEKEFELNDEMLDSVSGGVSEAAAAEGLYEGVELYVPCVICGHTTYQLTKFVSDIKFEARCLGCGYRGYGMLKAYGGKGWDLP